MLPLSPETEELIRAKAKAAGKSPDEFLRASFAGKKATGKGPDIERMKAIAREISELPVLDNRSPDEILEDAFGLP